ncbi:MAG: hypothetical protein WC661_01420 [Opitutaceae bacterium]|jgi:hypothetical protein
MYSPKIHEKLIPVLYRTADARSLPMTRLVDELLFKALAVEPIPLAAYAHFHPYRIAPAPRRDDAVIEASPTALLEAPDVHAFRYAEEVDAWHQASMHGLRRAARLYQHEHGFYTLPQAECATFLTTIRDQAVERLATFGRSNGVRARA